MAQTYSRVLIALPLLFLSLFAGQPGRAHATLPQTASSSSPAASCRPVWHSGSVPTPSGGWYGFYGMSAVSSSDIWAVGQATGGPYPVPLALHWNGTSWDQSSLPALPGYLSMLLGVAALSPTDAWAVGFSQEASGRQMQILHWDGETWSITTGLPNGGAGQLESIAAVTSTDIWAVGDYPDDTGATHTLILHWDGSQWSQVPSPSPLRSVRLKSAPSTSQNSSLWSVVASGPNDAWAAGQYQTGSGDSSFLEHWDGTQWAIVSIPDLGVGDYLTRMAMPGSNDAWAVGYRDVAPGERYPLTLHWDGSAWHTVAGPQIQLMTYYTTLDVGVAASSGNDVWYVTTSDGPPYRPVILHWNGKAWTMVPNSELPVDPGALFSVAAISPTEVWALGTTPNTDVTIGLHYMDMCLADHR